MIQMERDRRDDTGLPEREKRSSCYAVERHVTYIHFLLVRSRLDLHIPADLSDTLSFVASFPSLVIHVFPFDSVPFDSVLFCSVPYDSTVVYNYHSLCLVTLH